jgi:hypothetical protein
MPVSRLRIKVIVPKISCPNGGALRRLTATPFTKSTWSRSPAARASALIFKRFLLMNGRPARFIIYADRVEVNNANHAVNHVLIDPRGFAPFPKNPTLAWFFIQLGRVEELGSGMRNVMRYL